LILHDAVAITLDKRMGQGSRSGWRLRQASRFRAFSEFVHSDVKSGLRVSQLERMVDP